MGKYYISLSIIRCKIFQAFTPGRLKTHFVAFYSIALYPDILATSFHDGLRYIVWT